MIKQEAEHFNCTVPHPTSELLQQLLCHPWRGNVRELRSTAKRFVLGLPPLSASTGQPLELSLKDRLQRIEKTLIEESLHRHTYSVDCVASELGVAKRTLYYRMKQLGVALNACAPFQGAQ